MDSIAKIVSDLENERKNVSAGLLGSGDFEYAYMRLYGLLGQAIMALRQSDPSFGLQVMSYDEIVSREA